MLLSLRYAKLRTLQKNCLLACKLKSLYNKIKKLAGIYAHTYEKAHARAKICT